VLERLHFPKKRPVQIYRQYHPLEGIHSHEVQGVNRDWLAAYAQDDIKIPSHFVTPPTRWDREVLEWIRSYGRDRFAKLDIWDVDWSRKARELGCDIPPAALADPRSATDRAVMNWLARTQPRAGERRVRWAQRSLRLFGW
jgi:hypothetical protein